MLTQNDLKAFEKLIDKKTKSISIDTAAIETRLRDIEKGQISKLDSFEIRSILRDIEKRLAALETKTTNKDDLKKLVTEEKLIKALRGVTRRKDLSELENRLIKKINFVLDSVDDEVIETKLRVDKIENHLHLPRQV